MEFIKSAIFFIVGGWRFDDYKPHTNAHIFVHEIIICQAVCRFGGPTHVYRDDDDETFKDSLICEASFKVPGDIKWEKIHCDCFLP